MTMNQMVGNHVFHVILIYLACRVRVVIKLPYGKIQMFLLNVTITRAGFINKAN